MGSAAHCFAIEFRRDRHEGGLFCLRKSIRECPLLAQSRHSKCADRCPLSGVKRTSRLHCKMSAFDPKRTSQAYLCLFGLRAKPNYRLHAQPMPLRKNCKALRTKRLAQRGKLEDEGAREDQKYNCRRPKQDQLTGFKVRVSPYRHGWSRLVENHRIGSLNFPLFSKSGHLGCKPRTAGQTVGPGAWPVAPA